MVGLQGLGVAHTHREVAGRKSPVEVRSLVERRFVHGYKNPRIYQRHCCLYSHLLVVDRSHHTYRRTCLLDVVCLLAYRGIVHNH